ncbi:MAG: EamA family transporter [Gammaproteobacteria bacterium]|jgi:drug/metabolite transporter (DMT)-like permease|nr:EamA family transporter [Gammaproteobacteria bacterium]
METIAFALVLLAALMHASWNAMVKINTAPLLTISMMFGFITMAGIVILPWVPLLPLALWPWLLLSIVAHLGYKIYLLKAFRLGNFSQAYPIARGSGPIWVLLLSVFFAPRSLSIEQIIGVLVTTVGIIALSPWQRLKGQGSVVLAALITGIWIAAYTLIDGYVVTHSKALVSYICWLFILDGVVINLFALKVHGAELGHAYTKHWRLAALGGGLSVAAYSISLWAMTILPVALVAALRETSVLAAVLLAVVWIKEPLGPRQYGAALVICSGLVVLKLAS